jgi:WD40 repeat protein
MGPTPTPEANAAGAPDGRTLLATTGRDGTVRIWDPATGQQTQDPLSGHTAGVFAVCTLPGTDAAGVPDGRTLLAATSADGTVRIWDPATGQQTQDPLTGHTGGVAAVCTLPGTDATGAPDGRTLLAATSADGTVRIWDPATGQQTQDPLTGHTSTVWAVCTLPGTDAAGAPDGRTLLATTSDDGTLRVWDPTTGTAVGAPLASLPTAVQTLAPLHAPDPSCLALTADGTTHLWTPTTATWTPTPTPAPPHTTAVTTTHDDPPLLVSGDTAGYLHLTDLTTGAHRQPAIRLDDGAILALQVLPQASAVAAAGRSGTITIHPLTDPTTPTQQLHGHTAPVRALCLLTPPDHPPLLASAGNDATIRIWDLTTATPHGEPLTGHNGWIWALTALPGPDPRLASAGADATIRIWDPLTGTQHGRPRTGHTDQVRALAVATAPDGRTLLVSGSHDGTIRLWHPTTGQHIHTIPLGNPVHALLPQQPDPDTLHRTDNGATLHVGLRTGILTLDVNSTLFPTPQEF